MRLRDIVLSEWAGWTAALLLLISNVIVVARFSLLGPFTRWFRRSAVAWNNDKLTLYHGTDTLSLALNPNMPYSFTVGQVIPFTVDLSLCRPATDFGQGFYVTTSLHQAKEWANAKQGRVAGGSLAVVLRFDVDRNWLAGQDTLVFVRGVQDYWDFVAHCRGGLAVHNRYPHHPGSAYDVIYGLVTIWPRRILLLDCDQVSFHTDRAAAGLSGPKIEAIASQADAGQFPP
jgi:hypothetical protein